MACKSANGLWLLHRKIRIGIVWQVIAGEWASSGVAGIQCLFQFPEFIHNI